jgi:NADH:ubiquinone oxidoreductase subunit K
MNRLIKLQILGPAVLLLTIGAAEVAAVALARFPTSETLWYVNLTIFQVFQQSAFRLPQPLDFSYAQFFLVALPLFAIGIYGLLTERRFPLALATHLSVVYAAYIFYFFVATGPHSLTASLTSVTFASHPNIYSPLFLAGACLISFLISQYYYLLEVFIFRSKSRRCIDNP